MLGRRVRVRGAYERDLLPPLPKDERAPVSLFVGNWMKQVEHGRAWRSSAARRTYENERLSGKIKVPVGALDDPGTFEP